jgi:hypothetical protein
LLGNTAGGTGALINNTTGQANTAFGSGALSRNTTGNDSTATGGGALSREFGEFSYGNNETAVGVDALAMTGGNPYCLRTSSCSTYYTDSNTAIGVNALSDPVPLTSQTFPEASINTAVGFNALSNNKGESYATAI